MLFRRSLLFASRLCTTIAKMAPTAIPSRLFVVLGRRTRCCSEATNVVGLNHPERSKRACRSSLGEESPWLPANAYAMVRLVQYKKWRVSSGMECACTDVDSLRHRPFGSQHVLARSYFPALQPSVVLACLVYVTACRARRRRGRVHFGKATVCGGLD